MRELVRTRWAAVGAAIAITLGAGGVSLTHAAISSGDKPVFVSITPCRLIDTRGNVGDRTDPLGAGDTLTLQITGATGECSGIPADAVAAAMNVTAIRPTALSFLTVYPADADLPNASSLNWAAGDPPSPNKVDVALSAGGAVKMTNDTGSVHVAADLVGYYVDHTHDDRYYTETEVDAMLADTATSAAVAAKANAADVYTKTEVDSALSGKADAADVYTESEVDALVDAATPYERIVIVNGNGTPSENGTALVAAINTVTTATPTANSPWMIFLEPGVYEASSFPALPAHTTLMGSGHAATRIVDTDTGPAITASGEVTLRDLRVEQSGVNSTTVEFTSNVTMSGVRVIASDTASNSGAISVSGSGVVAVLDDVIVDDDDTGATASAGGIVVLSGATLELTDSRVFGILNALLVGSSSSTGTATIRNSYLDGTTTSIFANGGTVTVDNSVLTDQIGMGTGTYTQNVDVTVRNSSLWRVYFNGGAGTGTRSVTIENSTMSGNVVSGDGDANTSATIVNTAVSDGGGANPVDAGTEVCVGVFETSGPAVYGTTCP